MDELKKYLKEHAGQLNHDEPGEELWQRIQERTAGAAHTPVLMPVMKWMAAACVVLMAGIGSWYLLHSKSTRIDPVATTHKNSPVQSISPVEVQQPIEEEDLRVITANDKQNQPVQRAVHSAKHKALPPATDPAYSLVHNIESSFTQVINLQRNKLNSTPIYAESPEYFNDFKVQLRQMEKDEKQIKADIAHFGLNDELVEQLINLYQQKLNTLKQLQTEMNKLNNRYKKERIPADSTHTYFLNM